MNHDTKLLYINSSNVSITIEPVGCWSKIEGEIYTKIVSLIVSEMNIDYSGIG